MKYYLFLLPLFLLSCNANDNTSSAPAPADLNDFQVVNLPGSQVQKATRTTETGSVVEEGELLGGVKNGTWVTYYTSNNRPQSVTNFVNGKKNGLHLELNDRGQITLHCNYNNDILDGRWVKYQFGSRPEKEAFYKMGQLDGMYKEYHRNGKLLKEAQFKDGKMHGYFKQYNDEEQLVAEYEYNNGEIVK